MATAEERANKAARRALAEESTAESGRVCVQLLEACVRELDAIRRAVTLIAKETWLGRKPPNEDPRIWDGLPQDEPVTAAESVVLDAVGTVNDDPETAVDPEKAVGE